MRVHLSQDSNMVPITNVFGSHEGILVHMEDCVDVMHAPILTHCLTTAVVA